MTALGLHALQHRGQEAAGIVTYDKNHFHAERRMGLVSDTFTKTSVLGRLKGDTAIGHVRYSTTGGTLLRNVQPLFADLALGGFAVAHNGNLTNALTIRSELVNEGAIFQSTSDTESILQLVARSKKIKAIDKLIDAISQIEGAFALVALINKNLIGIKDPYGIRPLVIGILDGKYILSSETCALDIIGAKFVREVENGEIVIIDENGLESIKPFQKTDPRPCIFEYIYFSRPDSYLGGLSIYQCRKAFGQQLAKEAPIAADYVIPVPDSGVPSAIGYAEYSKIPFEPQQSIRALSVKLKHNINRDLVQGKKIILIDDSIVRGTTSTKIINMLREAGAQEIHMRITAPPIKYPDFYGIDTPIQEQLLAANNSIEEICDFLKADSISFLSVNGLYKAMGHKNGRDDDKPAFTDHCFTGEYPTKLRDRESSEEFSQLSLLSNLE